MAFMMSCRRLSTSSRVQLMCWEFWDISRPETATPPALAALPGPYRILLLQEDLDAVRLGGHVGAFGDQLAAVLDQRLGVVAADLVLGGRRERAVALDAPRALAVLVLGRP